MKHSRFGLVFFFSFVRGPPGVQWGPNRLDPRLINPPHDHRRFRRWFFVEQGASTNVTVQLVDAQGNQLSVPISRPPWAGSQATITRDSTFLATTNGSNLEHHGSVRCGRGRTPVRPRSPSPPVERPPKCP